MSVRYTVRLTREADKDLTRLRKMRGRAGAALRKLQEDPMAGHALSGTLAGARSLTFSMPGGAYRAGYVVREDKRRCVVFAVGPHEGFYKKAERRYEALRRSGA